MGQDWGGRRPANPKGAPTVTRAQVIEAAEAAGVRVQRGDFSRVPPNNFIPSEGAWSMWWFERDGQWLTMATTNYLAREYLLALARKS